MGEVDGHCGEGGAPGIYAAGEPGAGGESFGTAERGVSGKEFGTVAAAEIRPRGDGDNAISLLLPNRSRIVGLPGTEATVRGFSAVSMLLIDEASRVPDEMYNALRPMLAVGNGDFWLMSTPCGQRDSFTKRGWKRLPMTTGCGSA